MKRAYGVRRRGDDISRQPPLPERSSSVAERYCPFQTSADSKGSSVPSGLMPVMLTTKKETHHEGRDGMGWDGWMDGG